MQQHKLSSFLGSQLNKWLGSRSQVAGLECYLTLCSIQLPQVDYTSITLLAGVCMSVCLCVYCAVCVCVCVDRNLLKAAV